jgi:hypothetical protein
MSNGLLDFLQSASNAVAGNVAGPVDLLGLGLNKIGVNVGNAPVGGSEWMKRKGLMRDVQQGPARVLGETAGLLGPAMVTQFAPQIAKGLLQGADNLAAPATMNKQAGAVLIDPSDYRGQHTAPMKDNGAPLHELTKIYPDDIYSQQAAQYYGHYGGGSQADRQAVSLMQAAKNRPNMPVTMYRAVPYEKTVSQQVAALEKQMAEFMRRGKVPADSYIKGSEWYENAIRTKEKLLALAEQQPQRLVINNGDWVTLSKEYAKEHGEGALNGKYKIISKKVPARKLFTDGNSIQEFGYDESGKAALGLLGLIGAGVGGGAYLASDK